MKVPRWIIKNLNEQGNCYVKTSVIISIEYFTRQIQKEVDFEISYRETTDNDGYIIEKVK